MSKFINDILSTSSTFLFTTLISVLIGILFPRWLGAEEWGLWSLTISFISLLAPLAQLAMSTSLVTYISKFKDDKRIVSNFINSAYIITITSSFLTSLIIVLFTNYLANDIFQDSRLTYFLLIGSIILFFNQLHILNFDYFRGFKNFKKYNILIILSNVFSFILPTIFFQLFTYSAIYIAIAQGLTLSIISISTLFYLNKTENVFNFPQIPKRNESIKLLKFGVPLIFAASFLLIMKSLDKLLIGYFSNVSNVGIYSVATVLPFLFGTMFTPISGVLLPTFSERRIKGISSNQLLKELFSMLLFISIPLIIFIVFFSKEILLIIYGDNYINGSLVLSIASFEALFYGGHILFRTSIEATEKTGKLALGYGLTTISNIFLNIILIPVFGMEGAAIGTTLSFIFLFIFTIYFIKRNYEIKLISSSLKKIILLTLILIIFGYLFKIIFNNFLSLLFCLFTFLFFTFIFVHISNPIWYKEIKKIIKNVQKILRL